MWWIQGKTMFIDPVFDGALAWSRRVLESGLAVEEAGDQDPTVERVTPPDTDFVVK